MPTSTPLTGKATFNPKISTYILLKVAFFITISVFGIPLLLPWFLGLGQWISKRYYESLSCSLSGKHLEFKKGVFFKVEKTIPLENIQDLTFIENPLLKYLDLRILKIETAGHSNPQGSDMKLVGIIDALAFKERVLAQRAFLVGKQDETTRVEGDETLTLLREIRDILSQIQKGNNI